MAPELSFVLLGHATAVNGFLGGGLGSRDSSPKSKFPGLLELPLSRENHFAPKGPGG